MINEQVANFIAKAVLITAEQHEKRTGKPALKFLIELPAKPPTPDSLPTEGVISIDLHSYSFKVEILDTPIDPT